MTSCYVADGVISYGLDQLRSARLSRPPTVSHHAVCCLANTSIANQLRSVCLARPAHNVTPRGAISYGWDVLVTLGCTSFILDGFSQLVVRPVRLARPANHVPPRGAKGVISYGCN